MSLLSGWFKKNKTQNGPSEKTGLRSSLFLWIDKLEESAQPPIEITALNFGLFESDKGFMIYLTGSKVYNALDDDWASQIDYEPEQKLKYHLLKSVEILKWNEVLQMAQEYLKEFVAEHTQYGLFKNRVITTGFDDGELIVIKKI